MRLLSYFVELAASTIALACSTFSPKLVTTAHSNTNISNSDPFVPLLSTFLTDDDAAHGGSQQLSHQNEMTARCGTHHTLALTGMLAFLATTSVSQTLRSNIRELVDSIEVEEAKAEQLRRRIAASTGDTLDRQEELLRQLNKEVLQDLNRCRLGGRKDKDTRRGRVVRSVRGTQRAPVSACQERIHVLRRPLCFVE